MAIWVQKPPIGNQINWSHPLSQGMVGCWLFSEGGGGLARNLAQSTNTVISTISSPTFYNNNFQTGNGGNIITTTIPMFSGTRPWTFLTSFKLGVPSGNPQATYIQLTETTFNSILDIRYLNSEADLCVTHHYVMGLLLGNYSSNKKFNQVGFSYKGSGTIFRYILNGTVGLNDDYAVSNLTGEVKIGSAGSGVKAWLNYVYIYNRALSPSEIQSLYVAPYQMIAPVTRRYWGVIGGTSAALSGTVTTATETDIVNGGKTIILTLTGDTWITAGALSFDLQRQAIINGLTSAQSETFGWNLVPKALQGVAGVVRTSNTVVTITLDAFSTYNITATETITATIPGSALTAGLPIVASPTFSITPISITTGIMTTMSGFWGEL